MFRFSSPLILRSLSLGGMTCLLIACAITVFAQSRPAVKVLLRGSLTREGKVIPLSETKSVKPGEVLRWEILSHNEGQTPALNYQTTAPVPKGTLYIAESASGESSPTITFSIDAGRSYSAHPTISEKQSDGAIKVVAAPVSMYTQVRFQWNSSLPAASAVKAYYSTRVI